MTKAPDSNDSYYTDRLGRLVSDAEDRWLGRWLEVLENARNGTVLELGCGGGRDSRYLIDLGLAVVAGDYSEEALEICRERVPLADVRMIDLRDPLPFPDENFPVIVASLCLHFFDWPRTMAIMAEIRRCLKPGGFLLMRVNSTRDIRYDAAGHEEIEPNLFLVNGRLRRFFDREAMERMIGSEWKVHGLEELTVGRYGAQKVLWEAVLEKQREQCKSCLVPMSS
jgi:SAM-dependent methyltransferase